MRSFNVTSAGLSLEEERAKRMRFYFIAMTIRIACVASLFFVRGWWIILVALGAVFLPYLAVIFANEKDNNVTTRPDPVPPPELESQAERVAEAEVPIIVVDEPAERRARPQSAAPPEGSPQ